MEKSKGVNQVAFLTAIFCFCVIFIHLTADPVSRLDTENYKHTIFFIWNKMMTFVVPGFIFLSGLKLGSSYLVKEFRFVEFLKKRFSKIFVPYLVWYIMYYALFRYLGFMSQKDIFGHLSSFFLGTMVSPFYFITVIFQFYFLFFIFLYLFKKFNNTGVLIILSVLGFVFIQKVSFIYDDRFFMTYINYFVLGMFVAFNHTAFNRILEKYKVLIFAFTILISINNIYFSYFSKYYGIIYSYYRVKECLFSICWILLLFWVTKHLANKLPNIISSFITRVSDASFYIYLSHCFWIYISSELWFRMGQYSIMGRFVFSTIITLTLTLTLCFLYTKQKHLKQK